MTCATRFYLSSLMMLLDQLDAYALHAARSPFHDCPCWKTNKKS
jgi:hypothetical protein